jgi:hypothetical protein
MALMHGTLLVLGVQSCGCHCFFEVATATTAINGRCRGNGRETKRAIAGESEILSTTHE